MTKNRVIHARIDDDVHDRLFEKCNELGCSFTDYIQSIITASLEDEEPQVKVTLVEKEKHEPVMAHGKILDDYGNVIGTF